MSKKLNRQSAKQLVKSIIGFQRALWVQTYHTRRSEPREHQRYFRLLDKTAAQLTSEELIAQLTDHGFCWTDQSQQHLCVHLTSYRPLPVARALLSGALLDYEIRYEIMKDIRNHYNCRRTPETAHIFHALSTCL